MDIMRTNTSDQTPSIRRRNYPAEFKADVIKQAQSEDNSVAGVALRYGINPVTVHRWIREAGQSRSAQTTAFVPLKLTPHHAVVQDATTGRQTIRIDLGPQGAGVTLHWPMSSCDEMTLWLRAWLR